MNILLVYPRPNIFKPAKVIPLGLGYIASVLENAGHKVSIIDLNVQPDTIEDKLKRRQIDLVGISAVTPMIKAAWSIADRVKAFNKNIVVVLGGPHPTALPLESLKRGNIDIVVRGEGEYTMREVCERIERGQGVDDIKGISYIRDGNIKHNIDREFIKYLDILPFPAYHLFPSLDKYTPSQPLLSSSKKAATIMTSRGCPDKCVFCYKAVFGTRYRARSPANVFAEWKMLVEDYGVEEIAIQDDSFTLNKNRAIEVCRMIKREGLDIGWSTPNGIRADTASPELFSSMRKSGCRLVWFGIESGSQRVLDNLIQKRLTLQDVERAVKIAKKAGLNVGTFFVLGTPGETVEEMQQSVDFAIKLNPDYCQFTIEGPFPGTRLYDFLISEGISLPDDWDVYGHYEGHAYFQYDGVKKADIEKMFREAYNRFYIRPKYFLKLSTKKETYMNLPNILKGALHFIR